MSRYDRGRPLWPWLPLVLALLHAPAAAEAVAGADSVTPGPGYGELDYATPTPGSYDLPPLFKAADLDLVDSAGQPAQLQSLLGDRLVLLSFIYSGCSEVNGCPLAVHVLRETARRLQSRTDLAGQVRLITISFDLANDRPEVMREYAATIRAQLGRAAAIDWRFLTLASPAALSAMIDTYGQTLLADPPADGEAQDFSHLLRVYLIDRQQQVRNIYGVAFLHHDLLLNDLLTLRDLGTGQPVAGSARLAATTSGPGDDRSGYSNKNYRTRTRDLNRPRGRSANLIAIATNPPLGLPPLPVPADNPLTEAKVALGRKLFFDRRLSHNDTLSCAMCHVPDQGFTSNELAKAVGIEGRSVKRNTPTLFNVAYLESLFHDGREHSLEQQVWAPLLARNEMGNVSIGAVVRELERLQDYDGLFEQAFAGRGPDMLTLGQALASYQRTLLAADSAFDRWYFAGDATALSAAAQRGFELFRGRGNCISCHAIEADSALFTDQKMHNTGLGYYDSMLASPRTHRVTLAPGLEIDVEDAVVQQVAEPMQADLGRYEVSEDPDDRWKYRTPGLRNVALSAPYMHNGAFSSLEEVVDFYDRGGIEHEMLDPLIRPLGLSGDDKRDLVEFLNALTGRNIHVLIEDASAAPIGDR